MEMTELEEYQEFVDNVASRIVKERTLDVQLLWAAGELNAEAGEVMGEAVKIVRKGENGLTDERFHKMVDELGDTLWGVAAVANALNVSLDYIMYHNIDKLSRRWNLDGTPKTD